MQTEKRFEEFASRAMQGILSNPNCQAETPEIIAKMAVECAKALVEQLNIVKWDVEDAVIVE